MSSGKATFKLQCRISVKPVDKASIGVQPAAFIRGACVSSNDKYITAGDVLKQVDFLRIVPNGIKFEDKEFIFGVAPLSGGMQETVRYKSFLRFISEKYFELANSGIDLKLELFQGELVNQAQSSFFVNSPNHKQLSRQQAIWLVDAWTYNLARELERVGVSDDILLIKYDISKGYFPSHTTDEMWIAQPDWFNK